MAKLLITCKPMINRIQEYEVCMKHNGIEWFCPQFEQELNEDELVELVGGFDLWIIGDDPVTKRVLEAGLNGRLKHAVKWGVGTDNIDYDACKEFGFKIPNTPGAFNEEVSNIAIGYMLSLAHNIHLVDRQSREGIWYKPSGSSMKGKKVSVIGYGNIGRCLVEKLGVFGVNVSVYDPIVKPDVGLKDVMDGAEFVIVTCALTKSSHHLINKETIGWCKKGVYIINVSRGKVVNENDLIKELEGGYVAGAALDVFENEPLDRNSLLYRYNCILGSHNASNTKEAVDRVSYQTIGMVVGWL